MPGDPARHASGWKFPFRHAAHSPRVRRGAGKDDARRGKDGRLTVSVFGNNVLSPPPPPTVIHSTHGTVALVEHNIPIMAGFLPQTALPFLTAMAATASTRSPATAARCVILSWRSSDRRDMPCRAALAALSAGAHCRDAEGGAAVVVGAGVRASAVRACAACRRRR